MVRLFEFDAFNLLEGLVTGDNDLFAGLQTVDDFDMFWIAPAQPNGAAGGAILGDPGRSWTCFPPTCRLRLRRLLLLCLHDKKLVWTYTDTRKAGLHPLQILDVPGKPLKGRLV